MKTSCTTRGLIYIIHAVGLSKTILGKDISGIIWDENTGKYLHTSKSFTVEGTVLQNTVGK
jgi:hypothetical protein